MSTEDFTTENLEFIILDYFFGYESVGMMLVITFAIFVFLLTRIWIAYLHIRSSFYTVGDALIHLTLVKEIYNANGRIKNKLEKYLLDHNDYPNGFHKLFYILKIPLSVLERFGGFVPVLCDLGLLCFTALYLYLLGGENFFWLLTFPFLRMFIANEGRSSNFSERAFGVLWGNVFLGAMIGYYASGELYWLPVALVGFFIFSVSSKFSWQGTFFITFLLSVFEQSLFFIGFYLMSFVVSIFLSWGYSYKVLRGLIRHSIFYKTYLSKRYFGLSNHYRTFLVFLTQGGLRTKIMLSMTSSVCRSISDNPLNLALLFLLFTGAERDVFMSAALAGMILVPIIAHESLKFLGEPERYLEFSFLFVYLTLSHITVPLPVILGVFGIIGGYYIFHWYFFGLSHPKYRDKSMDMRTLLGFFEERDGGTILTLPLRLSFFLGYCTTSYKFVTLLVNIAPGDKGAAYKALVPDYYPYPGSNLQHYVASYAIDYIVQDKARIKSLDTYLEEPYYSPIPFTLVFENESYAVYSVRTDQQE